MFGRSCRYSKRADHDSEEDTEALGIAEGDRVTLRIEGNRVVVEKVTEDVWSDCTDFLPENFEKVLEKLRKDSSERFKRLGLTS